MLTQNDFCLWMDIILDFPATFLDSDLHSYICSLACMCMQFDVGLGSILTLWPMEDLNEIFRK